MKKVKFVFDLDGTITTIETLPMIAQEFHLEQQINDLTAKTVNGHVPFVESFIQRVHVLSEIPVSKISALLKKAPLYSGVVSFVQAHPDLCVIATGNLDCWIDAVCSQIGIPYFASHAEVNSDKIIGLQTILDKGKLVQQFKTQGYQVIFIGDGNNDLEGMREAHISIANCLTHRAAFSVLGIADYAIFSEESLCRLLNQLL